MSQKKCITVDKNRLLIRPLKPKTPIVVKKDNIKQFRADILRNVLLKNVVFGPSSSIFKEDVIFENTGDSPDDKVTVINRTDLIKNTYKTILTYNTVIGKVEKTSEQITKFIGQNNYDIVFNAICSLKDEQMKVNAIIALLSKVQTENQSTQTPESDVHEDTPTAVSTVTAEPPSNVVDKICQTDESSMEYIYKSKQNRPLKKSAFRPYAIKKPPTQVIKKVIVMPNIEKHSKLSKAGEISTSKAEFKEKSIEKDTELKIDEKPSISEQNIEALPVLDQPNLLSEDSNDNCSLLSTSVGSTALRFGEKFLETIGQHTEQMPKLFNIPFPNGHQIPVPVKPEFPFHIATPDILKHLNEEDRRRVSAYQLILDFKYCVERDSEGYLPIHNAVLTNDVNLLNRQCKVLKVRQNHVDITTPGHLTALQMSIINDTPECTAMLLQHGADPLCCDEESCTCLHLASESTPDHLDAVIKHCQTRAREVLEDHEELWKEDYQTKTDQELASILLEHACNMVDSSGYTPLMRAATIGNYTGVKMLSEASRASVNRANPTDGNTALCLAVHAACLDAANRNNKSKVSDRYYHTISILVDHGADLSIANASGTTVNDILAESNNTELSMLLSNKVTSVKFFDGNLPGGASFDNFMLYKNPGGEIDIKQIQDRPESKAKQKLDKPHDRSTEENKKKLKLKIIEDLYLPKSKIISKPILPKNVKKIKLTDELITKKTSKNVGKVDVPVAVNKSKGSRHISRKTSTSKVKPAIETVTGEAVIRLKPDTCRSKILAKGKRVAMKRKKSIDEESKGGSKKSTDESSIT